MEGGVDGAREGVEADVAKLVGGALELDRDPTGGGGALGDAVLFHAVEDDFDGVVAAGDIAGIPFAEGFFAAVGGVAVELRSLGAWSAGERLGEFGRRHREHVTGARELHLHLKANRPGGAGDGARGDVEQNTAVAVFCRILRPAPLDVEAVVFVGGLGGKVADGFAGNGEGAVGVVVAGGGEIAGIGGGGDEFPGGEIVTVEQGERLRRSLGAGDDEGGEESEGDEKARHRASVMGDSGGAKKNVR